MTYPVFFERPDLQKLYKDGWFCVDMHSHSDHSDGATPVRTIIKTLLKKNFRVALTDHNNSKGVLSALKERGAKKYIMPAIEVNSADGPHILAYFYDAKELDEYYEKYVKNWKNINPSVKINKGVMQIVEELKKYNCITSIAHPYGFAWTSLDWAAKHNKEIKKLPKKVHALEAINGCLLEEKNRLAVRLCEKLKKPFTAGSDGHIIAEFGGTFTCSQVDNFDEFLDNVKKGKNVIAIGKEIRLLRVIAHSMCLMKHIRYTPSIIRAAIEKKKKFNRWY